jgi:hypothetical protein
MKRLSEPKAKPGELLAKWGKSPHEGPDVFYCWHEPANKRDSNFLINGLGPVLEELKKRGYDLTTVKFSIQRAVPGEAGT